MCAPVVSRRWTTVFRPNPARTAMAIDIVRTVKDLRDRVHAWRGEGLAVGLVPTMGGLHEGHLSLVRLSLKKPERPIVTIFVNPKQFSEGEDFAVSPRHEDSD